ncbi:hypothetical protein LIER_27882 [Lithospermum erythrorhizon]|uniref:Uncharacterized protein n=1 Tax=Lithospermum erythrorhizon TaxID=34254 RepID=A0AAV3RH80_LITER
MGNAPQLPTSDLAPVVSPIPLVMWGIDLVGKLPKAKGGDEFAIATIDYFSKWVEANDKRLREYLNFTDELKDEALYKILKYKQLMARSYNRRVINCQFYYGDLVLRLCSTSQPEEQSKLSPK